VATGWLLMRVWGLGADAPGRRAPLLTTGVDTREARQRWPPETATRMLAEQDVGAHVDGGVRRGARMLRGRGLRWKRGDGWPTGPLSPVTVATLNRATFVASMASARQRRSQSPAMISGAQTIPSLTCAQSSLGDNQPLVCAVDAEMSGWVRLKWGTQRRRAQVVSFMPHAAMRSTVAH